MSFQFERINSHFLNFPFRNLNFIEKNLQFWLIPDMSYVSVSWSACLSWSDWNLCLSYAKNGCLLRVNCVSFFYRIRKGPQNLFERLPFNEAESIFVCISKTSSCDNIIAGFWEVALIVPKKLFSFI